ncbi:MAG: isoaspartyl peptidase/L-asparaginase [Gloeomargaritaceae cyanobacterium C42_A2020_066]|nr:isoaspartyl peptidase/L-asparaginase [Gloeomargaritaceae cyanobacterium C42_A2020_066]
MPAFTPTVHALAPTPGPKLIIHGGAGSSLTGPGAKDAIRKSLHHILDTLYARLAGGMSALEVVIQGCQLLEDDPQFNAGTGAVLQSDGQIRLSAALMDGPAQRFSGVINAQRLKNPIQLAQHLQSQPDRILSETGSQALTRALGLPLYDPLTPQRLQEWVEEQLHGQADGRPALTNLVTATDQHYGTIGVVALDAAGRLAAGTSTGGKGGEYVGRVSDSAMPAGTYANTDAAISCTGIGEDIVDECLAARLVIRVTDGFSLPAAFEKSFAEAAGRGRDLGAIGIDRRGAIAWGRTTEVILAAYHNGEGLGDSLEG